MTASDIALLGFLVLLIPLSSFYAVKSFLEPESRWSYPLGLFYLALSGLWAVAASGIYVEATNAGRVLSREALIVWIAAAVIGAIAYAVTPRPGNSGPEWNQALVVYLSRLADDVSGLEEAFLGALEESGAGVYDGDEFGPDGVTFYFFGPDADRLLEVIGPMLASHPEGRGATVELYDDWRQGKPSRTIVPPAV